MSRFLKLTKKHQKNCNQYQRRRSKGIPFVYWGIILGLFILGVAVAYLVQINGMATFGFELQKLEERAIELERINKKLELEVAELRSLSRITATSHKLGMAGVDKIEYISSERSSVVIK